MATPLPARNIFDGTAAPVTSTMKGALGGLRDYLAGLIGTTGAVADARAAMGVNNGLTNKLINGNFSINQRAVSGTVTLAAGIYGHDRWKAGAGGCTYTFATALNITTLTITAGTLMQVIEGVNLQSGSHKLSWTGTAQGRVDSGSYGATGVTGTAVGGTNQTVEFGTGTLSLVQYEFGSVVTLFEQRPIDIELERCQRYLPCISATAVDQSLGNAAFYSATAVLWGVPFQVPTRVPPTGIIASVTNALKFYSNSASVVSTAITFNNATINSCGLLVSAAGISGQACWVAANGAMSILFTGCEL